MKVVLIFGAGAVGKMTVGQQLSKITDLALFHNHMAIEPVLDVFGYYNTLVVQAIRDAVFQEFAKTNRYGLIFTFVWDFNSPLDCEYVEHIRSMFPDETEFYYVELDAPLEVRLQRNRTENRLAHKPSKQHIADSERRIIMDQEFCRFESEPGEITYNNYLRIRNENISAEQVAQMIKDEFQL